MTPNRWQRVKDLFNEAILQPVAERETFLQAKTGGDTELLQEVLSLLEHALPGTNTFDDLQLAVSDSMVTEELAPVAIGESVGAYKIVKELGRGGMAVVYEAERDSQDFDQRVAIKVMKKGLDTEAVVQRFRQERRLLAGLQHPSIARMYDGGTTKEGLPFFVMEKCEGKPLNEFANSLSLTQQIDLMASVSDAVAYAHQRLIIHRDLKPGNILIEENSTPKLLDFGIARIVDEEDSLMTAQGRKWLTPAYASPEQLSGEVLTTATDVYQLGLILLELVSGKRVFDRKRSAGEDIPIPAALPQDVRAILMKATAENAEDRYPSAAQFAEDLRKYLSGDPVEARVPTLGYRLGKLIARNKIVFGSAIVVFLSVLTAAGISFRQADIARQERDKAETTLQWLERMFQSSDPMDPRIGDADITVKEFLDQSLPVLQAELSDQPEVQARIWETATNMYAGLAEYDSANVFIQRALSLYEDGDEGKLGILMSRAQFHLDPLMTDSLYQVCLDYKDRYPEEEATRADIWWRWGQEMVTRGSTEQGDSLLDLALNEMETAGSEVSDTYLYTMHAKAMSRRDQGFFDEADALFGKVADLGNEVYPDGHPYVGGIYNSWGVNARYMEQYDTARLYLNQALEIYGRMLPDNHDDIITTLHNVALVMSETDSLPEAEVLYRQILELKGPKYGYDSYQYANTMQNLGLNLSQQKKNREALDTLTRVHGIYSVLLGARNPRVAFPLLTMTKIYQEEDQHRTAIRTIERADDFLRPILPETHPIMQDVALFRCQSLVQIGRKREAIPILEGLIEYYQQDNIPNGFNLIEAERALELARQ